MLVAVDTSDNARAALEWAADYAAATSLTLVAVHALGMLDRDASGQMVASQPHRAEITRWAEQLVAVVSDAHGIAAEALVRDGEPVPVVLAEAERLGAGLVVVGTRGAGRSRNPLGTTSTNLASRTRVALAIIPVS